MHDTDERAEQLKNIYRKFDLGVDSRKHLVQDTELNMAFQNGNQWVGSWRDNGVVPIENEFNELRVTDNRVKAFFQWRQSQMFNTRPVLTAFGGGKELKDAEAANVVGVIADFLRFNNGWETAEEYIGKHVDISGIGFMAPVWRKNPFASQTFKKKKFSEEAKIKDGKRSFIDEEDVQTYNADIAFDVYTASQTFTFPVDAERWESVQSVLTADFVTLEWLQNYLGEDLERFLNDADHPLEPFDETRLLNRKSLNNTRMAVGASFSQMFGMEETNEKYLLLQFRERPSFKHPNGRLTQVIGQHIFYEGEIPFVKSIRTMDPQDSYNIQMGIYPWIQSIEPGRLIPKSVMSDLRPKQVRWNWLKSDEVQNRKALGRNKLIVRDNAMDDDAWTDEHGEKITYHGDSAPQIIQAQPLSGLQLELQNLHTEMSEAAGQPEALQGRSLSQVRSSRHLDILREDASTIIHAHIKQRERFHEMTSKIVFAMVTEKYDLGRLTNIFGTDRVDSIIRFLDSDFIYDIRVKEGSARPRNKAQQEANVIELLQFGLFRDANGQVDHNSVLGMLEIGTQDPNFLHSMAMRQKVANENVYMLGLNVIGTHETDDHALEADEHTKFCQTPEFLTLSDDVKAIIFQHIDEHNEALAEEIAGSQEIPQPVSVTSALQQQQAQGLSVPAAL